MPPELVKVHYEDPDSETLPLIARNVGWSNFNHFVSTKLVKATATQNLETDRVGILNRIFGYVYRIGLAGKRLKKANRKAYYLLKYAIIVAFLYVIFF